MTFSAHAGFEIEDARTIIDDVSAHLAEHGVEVTRDGDLIVLSSHYGTCRIVIDDNRASLQIEADTETGIAVVKEEVAGHLIERQPELSTQIKWSGDGSSDTFPVWFCLLTVEETRRVTPHMQRITFRGSNLGRYSDFRDIHVRLMLPLVEDGELQWPRVDVSGVTHYPEAEHLAIRKYTLRYIDPDAGTLVIDFVLHEDAGPGSAFASRAKPGDVIGMGGPGGRSAPLDRQWYLLAGDETALPAIARILEALPSTATGFALIEVADGAEEQAIATTSAINIRWLHRNGAEAGTTPLLLDAVRSLPSPENGATPYYWVGCEHETCLAIKTLLRKERGISKREDFLLSYWRSLRQAIGVRIDGPNTSA